MPENIPTIERAVQTAVLNAESHWYEDGLSELLSGLDVVVFSLAYLAYFSIPHRSLVPLLLFPSLSVASGYFRPSVLVWIKSRITNPRTGYVPVPPSEHMPGSWNTPVATPAEREYIKSRRSSYSALFAFLMLASMMLYLFSRSLAVLFAFGALVVLALVVGRSAALMSWHVAAVGFALGIIAALIPSNDIHRMMAFVLTFGIVMSIDGAFKLKRFLHRYPLANAPAGKSSDA